MTSITSTLTTLFTKYPPHTIQRLAELLLAPKQHYKTLPSYLHALDRVVHVTSGAHTFPLPPAIPDPSSLTVLSNGTSLTASGKDPLSISWGNPASNPSAQSLGSDESLGGALLTPITWLQKNGGSASPLEGEVRTESTETIDGPNGPGGVETVSVSVNGISSTTSPPNATSSEPTDLAAALRAGGGITQGELLRQEQRAGVVPAAQLVGKGDESGMGEEDELPHARGPEEIGMEDVGMQGSSGSERMVGTTTMGMQGIDVEAAVGRRIAPKPSSEAASATSTDAPESNVEGGEEKVEAPTTPKREADEDLSGEGKKVKVDSSADSDPPATENMDIEIVDADGKAEDEAKVGEKGENKGGDAVDMSSV